MAQSKLELAVGTGQWDAGLRKAQQALNAFTQAQGGLQQALQKDNGDMQKFIQMIGKMDSTANTSKGQMNDYKRVLEQLTAQYNQMSEAQKKSIGQDYLHTIDALKQKFAQAKQQVDEFNRSLGETSNAKLPDIGGGGGLFGSGKLDGMLQVFGGNLMTKGAGMLAGLASEMGDMIKQGVELAKQGEGIRIAFERLGRGDILDGLREATHGTVTDLELMKAAVKFNDFKLPLEELGTMLAFAQQKAKDTGQSVDYMVDSIVTGLGRKSLMILDNLGLSAAEIKEKMAETGDMTKAVGEIIREQMSKAGDYVETAADRAAQANVNLQNKMEELGRKFAPLQEASNNLWTSMKIGIMDIVGGPLTDFLNKLTQAGRLASQYGVLGGSNKVSRMTSNLSSTREEDRQSIYQQQQDKFWRYINPREQQLKDIRAWQRGERGEALQGRISAITEKYGSLDATKIQAEVDAAKKMLADYQQAAKTILNPVKADIDTSGAERNVDSLKKKLNELEEHRKKAIASGDTELSKNLLKQINQTKADIRGLDPTALKTSTNKKTVYAEGTVGYQEELVQKLTKRWKEAGDAVRDKYKKELDSAQAVLDNMTGKVFDTSKVGAIIDNIGKTPMANISKAAEITLPVKLEIESPAAKLTNEINRLKEAMVGVWNPDEVTVYTQRIEELENQLAVYQGKMVKGGEATSQSWRDASTVISGVGSALNSIQDPSARIAAIVAQGIASLVAAYGDALAKDQSSKFNIYQFLGTSLAATAQMIAQISQIHSVTGYAEGGIIKGNSYSGDNIGGLVDGSQLVGLNAGELVLNKSQQTNLASSLQEGGGRSVNVTGYLRGEDIVLVADRWGRRTGKGELAFWK